VTAIAAAAQALLGVYSRVGPAFVAGDGCHLVTADGARYLDLTAGLAVNALGYGHPAIRDAVRAALATGLVHASNLYHTEPAERLARELCGRSFASAAFFCNSGAEANEGAFKFARRWTGRTDIVAFAGGFHGRLFASLAATDRPDFRAPFEPLLAGVRIVPLADRSAVERAVTERTAAAIVEPIQGEGGVRVVADETLAYLRALCDERGAALIFDEVQCGLGRTGTLFAHEASGVVPDLLTLAKPLGGGLPMGAVLLSEPVAAAIRPGDHATTFGGGPLVASTALAVVRTIAEPAFLAAVRAKGEWLGARLRALAARSPRVREVRGRGLMWGIELTEPVAPFVTALRERRVLVVSAGPTVIRLIPPLVIDAADLERGVAAVAEVLE
jgi:predicted acetylornithine/succinylornithine family transaminase